MTYTDPAPSTDDLDAALRALDVADHDLSPQQTTRKDALLTSLLGRPAEKLLEPTAAAPARPAAAGSTADPQNDVARRRRRRAAWAAPLLAAAAAAAWFAWPAAPGAQMPGQPTGIAFASWTATPTPVDAATRAAVEKACRHEAADSLEHMGAAPGDGRPTLDPAQLRTVVAERRGEVLFIAMTAPDGSDQECFASASRPDQVSGASGGVATTDSPRPRALGPEQIDIGGSGQFSEGGAGYSHSLGRVGSAVRGVTVHSAGRVATATVSNGYAAAWWPARPLPVNAPSPRVVYDVTLADGRVIHDAPDLSASNGASIGPRQVGNISHGGGAAEGGAMVSTLGGEAGADAIGVVVHAGPQTVEAPLVDHVFSVQLPSGTDASSATFDLTLKDGTVLKGQRPVGH